MTETARKATAPGWYVDERWPGEQRRWDGTRWLDDWRTPPSGITPGWWVFFGLLLAALLGIAGAAVYSADEGWGLGFLWLAAAVSGTMLTIGVIGKAVEVGVRAARE